MLCEKEIENKALALLADFNEEAYKFSNPSLFRRDKDNKWEDFSIMFESQRKANTYAGKLEAFKEVYESLSQNNSLVFVNKEKIDCEKIETKDHLYPYIGIKVNGENILLAPNYDTLVAELYKKFHKEEE